MPATSRLVVLLGLVLVAGCGSKPDKAIVEKRIRNGLAQSSRWTDVAFEMKADDTITTAGAHRVIDGSSYWFSFTGGDGSGGVAVQSPTGQWLCKYRYERGQEVHAEKTTGSDDDVARLRGPSAEFASVCIASSS